MMRFASRRAPIVEWYGVCESACTMSSTRSQQPFSAFGCKSDLQRDISTADVTSFDRR